jgi:DUF1009 family protein
MARLGIIAGGGGLPKTLVAACRRDHRPFFVLGFDGQTDEELMNDAPHAWTRLGATNDAIKILKDNDVDQLVMAGHIRRPSILELRPDWRTIQVFAKLGAKAFGDDALLRAVADELEKENFIISAAHEIEPALITPEGVLGKHLPSVETQTDIGIGIHVSKTLGALDVGQSVIVQEGIVLGVEAVEGTDALLDRCRKLHRKGRKGVLVKSCKPQQDRRLDLPAIGMTTLRKAYQAGLAGIAVEASASYLLDRAEVVDAANRLGLFLLGFKAPEHTPQEPPAP